MKRLFLLFALLPSLAWAGDNDDWGTWLGLGAKKSLPYNLEVGLEGNLRTMDGSGKMDRWDIGANLGYKAHKYLKLSAGYSFLHDNNLESEERSEHAFIDMAIYKRSLIEEHWSSRHRLFAEASSSVKLGNWMRLSGYLRYQYTYTPSISVDRYCYEEKTEYTQIPTGEYDANNNPLYTYEKGTTVVTRDEWEKAETESRNRQVLRSRIMLELDKDELAWKPFASVQFHNNLASNLHFDKLRTAVGTSYRINEHNAVSLAYVYTLNRKDQSKGYYLYNVDHFHAISASYSLDF